jgi:hypothetical protein
MKNRQSFAEIAAQIYQGLKSARNAIIKIRKDHAFAEIAARR